MIDIENELYLSEFVIDVARKSNQRINKEQPAHFLRLTSVYPVLNLGDPNE